MKPKIWKIIGLKIFNNSAHAQNFAPRLSKNGCLLAETLLQYQVALGEDTAILADAYYLYRVFWDEAARPVRWQETVYATPKSAKMSDSGKFWSWGPETFCHRTLCPHSLKSLSWQRVVEMRASVLSQLGDRCHPRVELSATIIFFRVHKS